MKKKKKEIMPEKLNGVVHGFADFMRKYSILPLAVGLVIGQTTKDVVDSLVKGIISPLLAILFEKVIKTDTLSEFVVTFSGKELLLGQFIDTLIKMVIIMLIIYILLGVLLKQEQIVETKKKK
jgi:large conductance mechanosensitive channel